MAKVLLALLPAVLAQSSANLRGSSLPEPFQVGKVPFHVRGSHNRSAERHKWFIKFPGNWSTANLHDYAGRMEHEGFRCIHKGHPSERGIAVVTVEATLSEMEDFVSRHEGPVYVEEDVEVQLIPTIPSSLSTGGLVPWGLDRIDSQSLDNEYSPQGNGDGVHVYLVDSGIRIDHVDFGGRAHATLESLGNGVVECASSSDPNCGLDETGHGTHCAGTVGGTTYGVAKGATIHSVKIFGATGTSPNSYIIAALDWIAANAIKPAVVSMSLGGEGRSQLFLDAINVLTQAGVTVVVASGNDDADASMYSPAYVDSAITVGATDSKDARASFSNYGEAVDIMAPGVNIVSADFSSTSGWVVMSGTSMATPHVAGAAALILQSQPQVQPETVKEFLVTSALSGVIDGLKEGSPNLLLHVD